MLETIIIVLMILWLLGLVSGTAGNFIWLLLVVALAVFVIRLVTGRKAV
ncbi:MAG: lmo0937 family membrane protein [Pyrinomonadaceae bacterium]|nr:lmo0937 family membrane protein [Pyrinomonadaceae bacterium]